MSFLTQNVIRRVALAPRIIAFQAPRSFTTSFAAQRTATDAVKDTAKKVDRVVSDKIVDGIETGETVAAKAKEAAKNVTGGDIAAKAQELKGEAVGKAQELKGDAASKAQELKGEAKGTAEQAKGKAQELKGEAAGKAQELKGEAKGTAEQAKGKAKGAAEEAKHKL